NESQDEIPWEDISNFIVEFEYDEVDVDHPEKSDIQRYIRLSSDEVKSWSGLANSSSFVNLSKFKEFIQSKGDFVFYGDERDLQRVYHLAIIKSIGRKRVQIKSIVGRDEITGLFMAGNCAIDTKGNVYEKNEKHLIEVYDSCYKMNQRDTDAKVG